MSPPRRFSGFRSSASRGDIHVYDFDSHDVAAASATSFVHTTHRRPGTVVARGGLTMTSPPVTAVDLMRVLPAPFGLAVGDAVDLAGPGREPPRADELETVAAEQSNRRGRALLTTRAGDDRSPLGVAGRERRPGA